MPKKSLIAKFPTEDQVPEHLQRHFVRGYFDGDGCISTCYQYQLNFMGTLELLKGVQNVLVRELNFSRTKMAQRDLQVNTWTLHYSGRLQMKKFRDWLYADSLVHLDRKFQKFEKIE